MLLTNISSEKKFPFHFLNKFRVPALNCKRNNISVILSNEGIKVLYIFI